MDTRKWMRLIAKPLRSGIFQKVGVGLKEAENRLIFENGRTPGEKDESCAARWLVRHRRRPPHGIPRMVFVCYLDR